MWRKGKKRADGESGGGDGAPPYKKAARDDSDDSADGIVVCELSKNRRVSVRTFQGKIVVDIREFYVKDGKTLPGKKVVHSKKRNCLLQEKLNELVFIQYNKS